MKVYTYSRSVIEQMLKNGFPENTAVINFYEPTVSECVNDCAPIDYQGKAAKVFDIILHDVDLSVLPYCGLTYETYFPEAYALAEFIFKAKCEGLDIICQSEFGRSSSAGCAAAILEFFYGNGITVFADFHLNPSPLVFNKVLEALKSIDD